MRKFVFVFICAQFIRSLSWGEGGQAQYKNEDEPKLVSWRVLEGVTEPFESFKPFEVPLWKQMKDSADQKASGLLIKQALHEYGQLIRNPLMFGEVPMEERYDIFLSMSSLLKQMGFQQRAELLLYEAMSYSSSPHEAHLQLSLLLLDRENLEMAKVHLKNCLFFRETDVLVLVHLTVVLMAEGRIHESKFFITRILSQLQPKYDRLSKIINIEAIAEANSPIHELLAAQKAELGVPHLGNSLPQQIDHAMFYKWLEELMARVFHGDLRITTSSTIEYYKMFSVLYEWIVKGEMTGRFIFDLGQALYEGGRPKVGQAMMKRGLETSNTSQEGVVSPQVVKLRLAVDHPVIPAALIDIVDSYLNTTNFLSSSSADYIPIDMENVFDIYWPLPLLGWSALPTWPVVSELMWRFSGGPQRNDATSLRWLANPLPPNISWVPFSVLESTMGLRQGGRADKRAADMEYDDDDEADDVDDTSGLDYDSSDRASLKSDPAEVKASQSFAGGGLDLLTSFLGIKSKDPLPDAPTKQEEKVKEIPRQKPKRSQPDLQSERPKGIQRPLAQHTSRLRREVIEIGIFGGHMNSHPVGQMVLHRLVDIAIASANFSDASGVFSSPLFKLTLIALPLMPDLITKNIAASVSRIVNLPMDTKSAWSLIESLHLDIVLFPDWQPFPDVQSALFQWSRIAPVQVCIFVRGTSCSSASIDYYLVPSEISAAFLAATPAADSTSTSILQVKGRPSVAQLVRPPWREFLAEQAVFLEWPLVTASVIASAATLVVSEETVSAHRRGKAAPAAALGKAEFKNKITQVVDGMDISSIELEGQIFFEGQPVAIIAAHPTHIHPLMDDTIFKIMHTVPTLQVVLVLPDSFFSHATDMRQRTCWSRKLVRRLWDRGGDLFHRIRLLPSSIGDLRLLQLLRQADMVLDSFPLGGSFHTIALALSVGTPVVTMRSGVVLSTPPKDLREIKHLIQQHAPTHRSNPLYRQLVKGDDLPWSPTMSAVAGWYDSVGLSPRLTADNISQYAQMASKLATEREMSYDLRVQIMDLIDSRLPDQYNKDKFPARSDDSEAAKGSQSSNHDSCNGAGPCVDDLSRFLYRVGRPWANARLKQSTSQSARKFSGRSVGQVHHHLAADPQETPRAGSSSGGRRRRRSGTSPRSSHADSVEEWSAGRSGGVVVD